MFIRSLKETRSEEQAQEPTKDFAPVAISARRERIRGIQLTVRRPHPTAAAWLCSTICFLDASGNGTGSLLPAHCPLEPYGQPRTIPVLEHIVIITYLVKPVEITIHRVATLINFRPFARDFTYNPGCVYFYRGRNRSASLMWASRRWVNPSN